jgi:hypothetical protein
LRWSRRGLIAARGSEQARQLSGAAGRHGRDRRDARSLGARIEPRGERLEARDQLGDHDGRTVHLNPLDDARLVGRCQASEEAH